MWGVEEWSSPLCTSGPPEWLRLAGLLQFRNIIDMAVSILPDKYFSVPTVPYRSAEYSTDWSNRSIQEWQVLSRGVSLSLQETVTLTDAVCSQISG